MIDEGYDAIRGNVIDVYIRERKLRSDAYRKLLVGFEKWLADKSLDLYSFQIVDVEDYCNEKIAKGEWTGSSANTFVAYLKGFCKWLSGYALSNAENARLRRIRGVRLDIQDSKKKVFFIQLLNMDIFKKILKSAYQKSPKEDFVYMWLLGWHGFRVGELISIEKDKIFFKKSKFKEISIPENAIWVETEKTRFMRLQFFDDYTAEIWKKVKKGNINLNVSTQHIRNRMRRYDKVAGIHLHPHQLRMLFNTYMKNNVNANASKVYNKFGVMLDENIVKVMMGHSVVMSNMTELYNKYNPELIKYIMSDLHYMKNLEKTFNLEALKK